MSWGAVIIGGGAIIGGIIGAGASESAAEAQATGSTAAAEAQLEAAQISADAMIASAGIASGAAIKGAELGATATREAAQIAAATQMKMYNKSRAALAPYERAGREAMGTLTGMMEAGPGEFAESPGYQFRLAEGTKNILAGASATGSLASGRTLKALQEYGQDYASFEYDKFINRYYQSLQPYQYLTSVGESAAAMQGSAAMQTGAQIGATQMQAGTNLASIYSNMGAQQAQIQSNLGNALASNYMQQGNITAQNFMNQGNIAAAGAIGQSNAWTSAINQGMMLYGMQQGGWFDRPPSVTGYGGFGGYGIGNPSSYTP